MKLDIRTRILVKGAWGKYRRLEKLSTVGAEFKIKNGDGF